MTEMSLTNNCKNSQIVLEIDVGRTRFTEGEEEEEGL